MLFLQLYTVLLVLYIFAIKDQSFFLSFFLHLFENLVAKFLSTGLFCVLWHTFFKWYFYAILDKLFSR